MVVINQGIIVSGIVGSVAAQLTMGSSARSETRSAICVESPLTDPSMAHTFSSYIILTISLLDAPQVAASLCTFRRNGLPPYPPRALASSTASCAPCSMASPSGISLLSSIGPRKPTATSLTSDAGTVGTSAAGPLYSGVLV